MHQEYCELFHLELDDQALDSRVEVMKFFPVYARRCHECVALLAHNRQNLVQRFGTVFGFIRGIHTEVRCDFLCLIYLAAAYRAGVDLYEPNNIRINRFHESGNFGKDVFITLYVARTGERHMHARTAADSVSNVVQEESHGRYSLRYRIGDYLGTITHIQSRIG